MVNLFDIKQFRDDNNRCWEVLWDVKKWEWIVIKKTLKTRVLNWLGIPIVRLPTRLTLKAGRLWQYTVQDWSWRRMPVHARQMGTCGSTDIVRLSTPFLITQQISWERVHSRKREWGPPWCCPYKRCWIYRFFVTALLQVTKGLLEKIMGFSER